MEVNFSLGRLSLMRGALTSMVPAPVVTLRSLALPFLTTSRLPSSSLASLCRSIYWRLPDQGLVEEAFWLLSGRFHQETN